MKYYRIEDKDGLGFVNAIAGSGGISNSPALKNILDDHVAPQMKFPKGSKFAFTEKFYKKHKNDFKELLKNPNLKLNTININKDQIIWEDTDQIVFKQRDLKPKVTKLIKGE